MRSGAGLLALLGILGLTLATTLAQPPAAQQPGANPAPEGRRGGRAGGRGGAPAGPGQEMNDRYLFGPDSQFHEGVPRGQVSGPNVIPCQVFPGTQHSYWVYVPAQYNPAQPTALMVFNDGLGYLHPEGKLRIPAVLDNLISRREIPPVIGVFINPGRRPDQTEATWEDWGDQTTNRPEEYNSIDDRYARVITEELLPDLNKTYNISKDPQHRAICGSSSGGIAAFGVAWHRPQEFGKVISLIGTFVNLGGRGGHTFSDKVLATERKPIRVFLYDGRNDNRRADSQQDWFFNNVKLKDALVKQGYDVSWSWGVGPHSSWAGGTQYPEMLRWLWRDQPVSVDPADMVERNYRGAFAPAAN